ncbi:MAG TPA: hypothetical protein VFB06_22420 [Streptosporangiaceae bacterium]|nr:hypothetical protein [Streptosporangiaceae bacterium]
MPLSQLIARNSGERVEVRAAAVLATAAWVLVLGVAAAFTLRGQDA